MDDIVELKFSGILKVGSIATGVFHGDITINYSQGSGGFVTNYPSSGSIDWSDGSGNYSYNNLTVFDNNPSVNGNPVGYTITKFDSGFQPVLIDYFGERPTSFAFFQVRDNTNAPYQDGTLTSLTAETVCFAAGTLIRTMRGDVAIEGLAVGDIVMTASGDHRPIKWLGHRTIPCRAHPNRWSVLPVRIAAHAFGTNRPSRDLLVSPAHAIGVTVVDEVLIGAGALVNGSTIAQVEVDEVTYWHVELDSHDVLLANNLPAESFLAMGNRGFFTQDGPSDDDLPQQALRTHADFCRPFVASGPTLAAVRDRLAARAAALGWSPSTETDLHLIADGAVVRPLGVEGTALFIVPATAGDVCLRSNTFTPARLGLGDDRALGLSISGLTISASRGEPRRVMLDDPRLQQGFHAGEAADGETWRWTTGALVLPPSIWEGLSGQIVLAVTHDTATIRGWTAPAQDKTAPVTDNARPALYAVK